MRDIRVVRITYESTERIRIYLESYSPGFHTYYGHTFLHPDGERVSYHDFGLPSDHLFQGLLVNARKLL